MQTWEDLEKKFSTSNNTLLICVIGILCFISTYTCIKDRETLTLSLTEINKVIYTFITTIFIVYLFTQLLNSKPKM